MTRFQGTLRTQNQLLVGQPPRPIGQEKERQPTYHSIRHDVQSGAIIESIYNSQQQLLTSHQRAPGYRFDQYFDPPTGARKRSYESITLTDGNSRHTDVVYCAANKRCETVTTTAPDGGLIALTERQLIGSMITFQGQTDYHRDGTPAVTLNQHHDVETGNLAHAEQIHWLREGHRAMTEHLFFDRGGRTTRYIKVLYYAGAGPFSEQTQDFDPQTDRMVRQELVAYNQAGLRAWIDVLYYHPDGSLAAHTSSLFDAAGSPVSTRCSGAAGGPALLCA